MYDEIPSLLYVAGALITVRFSRRTQDSWIPMSSISMTSRSYGYCRR